MHYELRRLSTDDGMDIYNMLQEIPKEKNGVKNAANGKNFDGFKKWLVKNENTSKGIHLEDWMVPQTTYWLYVDGSPVGFGKLRHSLTEKLELEGGHAGYSFGEQKRKRIRNPSCCAAAARSRTLGIEDLLVTIQKGNAPSVKVALANGGRIEKINNERHYIWVSCTQS
jgi:predicted acetyltransferase